MPLCSLSASLLQFHDCGMASLVLGTEDFTTDCPNQRARMRCRTPTRVVLCCLDLIAFVYGQFGVTSIFNRISGYCTLYSDVTCNRYRKLENHSSRGNLAAGLVSNQLLRSREVVVMC